MRRDLSFRRESQGPGVQANLGLVAEGVGLIEEAAEPGECPGAVVHRFSKDDGVPDLLGHFFIPVLTAHFPARSASCWSKRSSITLRGNVLATTISSSSWTVSLSNRPSLAASTMAMARSRLVFSFRLLLKVLTPSIRWAFFWSAVATGSGCRSRSRISVSALTRGSSALRPKASA